MPGSDSRGASPALPGGGQVEEWWRAKLGV